MNLLMFIFLLLWKMLMRRGIIFMRIMWIEAMFREFFYDGVCI